MNTVQIRGNLTKDVDLKHTQTGKAVAKFTVAASRTIEANGEKKELTDYIPVVVWGGLAESVAAELKKGSAAVVVGRYTSRSYEAQDGTKKYITEVVAETVAKPIYAAKQNTQGGFSRFGAPEDIPF